MVLFMYIMCCIYVVNIHNIDNLCSYLILQVQVYPYFYQFHHNFSLTPMAAFISAESPSCDDRLVAFCSEEKNIAFIKSDQIAFK